jgi:MFS family permease
LVGLNLVRCVFALSLVAREPSLAGIFAATLGLWTIQQFYSPTESAALAMIVPRRRYASAQAMSNLALTLAQLFGLVILAPLLLKTADPRVLFGLCALLFILAAGYAARLPALDEHVRDRDDARRVRSLRGALLGGWRAARADHVVYEALADDVLIGVGMSALIVIMPLYLKRVLGTGAENTVFVFAPAALGLVIGLRYAPRIGRVFDERRTATFGLIGFACCVASLGFVTRIYDVLTEGLRLPLDEIASMVRIPALVIVAMLISIPAGFGSALVSVTARAVLLDRTPATLRGQVLSTQMLLGNLGALGPTLLSGIAADLFGVEPIAVAIACLIAGGAVLAHIAAARPVPVPSTS